MVYSGYENSADFDSRKPLIENVGSLRGDPSNSPHFHCLSVLGSPRGHPVLGSCEGYILARSNALWTARRAGSASSAATTTEMLVSVLPCAIEITLMPSPP